MIKNIVQSAAFNSGKTFQELYEIGNNALVLYKHGDLIKNGEKRLSVAECLSLQIYDHSRRSRFFVFKDYFFKVEGQRELNVKATLLKNQAPDLISLLIKESLIRVAKAIAVLALAILTSPLWVSSFIFLGKEIQANWIAGREDAFKAHAISKIDLPPEPADSHVAIQDVIRIGNAMLGYRHVSTEEHAQANAREGINQGCSLNLSFCHCDNFDNAIFQGLHVRVLNGENCAELIKSYELAITSFIINSIGMDAWDFLGRDPSTFDELFQTLDQSRFMITRTRWHASTDIGPQRDGYGGLGRLAKENLPQGRITLLRRIQREELGIPQEKNREPITSPDNLKALSKYLASHYRRELLRYIREDFDADLFEKHHDLPLPIAV